MANHKRRRPKSSRAGCIICKTWKHQACKDSAKYQTAHEYRAKLSEKEQLDEFFVRAGKSGIEPEAC